LAIFDNGLFELHLHQFKTNKFLNNLLTKTQQTMKKLFFLLTVFAMQFSQAQTTTSNIKGTVKNAKDTPLSGVNITAVQTSTGTRYAAISNADGRFNLLNMKVGGSYKVTATAIGFQTVVLEDIYLELGKTFTLDLKMTTDEKELQEVVVNAAKNKTFDSGRTGAQTTVGRRELTTLPSISRSAQDFTRLEPTASGGSFGGRSDKLNNFSLNGAVFNNPFGLDAATPGGQTDAQPISLDAIEQIQVATAPYDVTLSGFTGASVNAVTKSGTNDLHATAYTYYRNQDLTGNKIKGEKIFVPALQQVQAGLSIGGSIIKNKLFFFGNFEIDKRSDLGSNYVANNGDGVTGINESRVLESDLIAVSTALGKLGYNTGAYQGYTHNSNSAKAVLKLDWNINDNNKLSLVTNMLDASKDKNAHPTALGNRGPNASILQFEKSGYQINNKLYSALLEWNSKFTESTSNKFQLGYTRFDDFRNPFSSVAPVITIQDGNSSNYIIAGHEPFSIHNTLDQRVLQVTDNLNYNVGNHALTFGASVEKFSFKNSFNLTAYENFGPSYHGIFYPYASVANFLSDVYLPSGAINTAGTAYLGFQNAQTANNTLNTAGVGNPKGWKLAELNVGQAAVYVQDEWSMANNFKFTMGIRFDKPLYFDTEDLIKKYVEVGKAGSPFFSRDESYNYFNPNTKQSQKLVSSQLPSNAVLVSPRVGFNWDVNNNKKTQIRGGVGVFTGKLPFVWLGNQVSGADDGYLEIMDPNFKWPQVFRTSLGFDQKFANDMILTIDLAYSNDINGIHVQNWGLKDPTGRLSGVDNRAFYLASDKLAQSAYVMTNANGGYSFNSSVKLQKNFKNGVFASIAANRMISKDINSIEAEITGDAFDFNPVVGNANNAVLSNSKYGDTYRFIAVFSKKFKYGSNDTWATTISTFGEYARGGRYSYTYGGDINGDGKSNDLLFIPTTAQIQTMAFTGGQAQRDAYNAFIEQDEYLSGRRGQYAERYGALAPWRAKWDVKIIQDYNFKISSNSEKKNTIQLSLDILNFGNLLNSDWGLTQTPISVQPIGVNVVGGVPTYTYNGQQTKTFNYDSSLLSRWQAQFGVRYIF
jgi:hypothetical protein